jgi:hypothetical protein
MKISDTIVRIQELADKKLVEKYDFYECYVSLGICCCYDRDCAWQVWLDFNDANGDLTHKVIINNTEFVEEDELTESLKTMEEWVNNCDLALRRVGDTQEETVDNGKLKLP